MLITALNVDNFLPKNVKKIKKFGYFAESDYLCRLIGKCPQAVDVSAMIRSEELTIMSNTFQAFSYPHADGYGQLPLQDDRPVVLITNDDGYKAGGINALVDSLRGLCRIVVCAPDSPRSGFSASFTCTCPVSLQKMSDDGEVAVYACSGTPVDCVKLALHRLFSERHPNLIVSGINHGGNESICVMYSGTMGAAMEGCVVGIPSIGFSLLDHDPAASFAHAVPFARDIVKQILDHPLPSGVLLNVNIPSGSEIKGVRVCRQAAGKWEEEFHYLEGDENQGKSLFQVTGVYVNLEPEAEDTDRYWLEKNYVSVVPQEVDYTSYPHLGSLSFLEC